MQKYAVHGNQEFQFSIMDEGWTSLARKKTHYILKQYVPHTSKWESKTPKIIPVSEYIHM